MHFDYLSANLDMHYQYKQEQDNLIEIWTHPNFELFLYNCAEQVCYTEKNKALYKYQNQDYGTAALVEFIRFMKDTYDMSKMTTTYVWGNEHAKHIYEKIGFTETDVVDETDCHEVNMVYYC